ncbi:SRPBCC family protein [Pelomonas sp. SE-A7]|uniref:SRPBCC family protein n=1 Tax=Pelomonas sp. SE-A7 TaxID=3054953 RepID=UPI00259C9319|nr:SRPBCC family protein [Pelomonas sp. SE-A7]MDM4767854.1 SRPBCC family protein [Pelomonas sp. SE-A7]
MKILKTLGLILLALLAVLLVGGMLMSPKYKVQRTVAIKAAPDKVYALVANPRQWKQWSIWNQRDPNMTIEYSGPESGAGAVWSWKSKTEGDGKMSFTAAEPPKRVVYSLYFPDFESTSTGEMRLEVQGEMTQVTWTMDGDMGGNPLMRWFALFMDGMIGKDFEGGLNNLKVLAEKA